MDKDDVKKIPCSCYYDGTYNELMNMDSEDMKHCKVECERCKLLRKLDNV